jgi:hypothetical protein
LPNTSQDIVQEYGDEAGTGDPAYGRYERCVNTPVDLNHIGRTHLLTESRLISQRAVDGGGEGVKGAEQC